MVDLINLVIKQRMQMKGSKHTAIWRCAVDIARTEGIKAFYISFPTTLAMTMPFQAIQFTSYEYAKKLLNPTNQYSPLTHCLSGAVAGGIASFITNPLDVVKTVLQTRGACDDTASRNVSSMREAIRLIHERHGALGFFRGVTARILTHAPSTAVAWTTVIIIKPVRVFKTFIL
jgi:solute carrier family 25 iron transporter 28/37